MAKQVHRVRFYSLETNSIKCMSLEKTYSLLAVSREDNSIEIWNVEYTPFIETTILSPYGTIDGLAWFGKRLFSVGPQGSIIEYDLSKQTPKSMHPISSSGCCCLSIHETKKQLAAGTGDGYINIFDIYDDELVYNKVMDKQEGQIYCISWDFSGDYLITGSIDTIRVWKVTTGHAIHRLLTGRDMNRKETIVWSLAVTDDFTIISGDSRGKLCFWDGNNGISIATYHSHKADILSVCLTDDQNTVYCAGVDPLIATYERVKMRGNEDDVKWVKSIQRIIHEHDVRCLVVHENKLFSAGVDGYLALSSYPPKVLIKYPPLLQAPCVQLAPKSRLMLLRYPNSVTLWELNIGKTPVKLVDWRPPVGLRIKAASISQSGEWFACSTQEKLRIYSLTSVKNIPILEKLRLPTKKCLAGHHLTFSGDSSTLVVATFDRKIYVIKLENQRIPVLKYTIKHPKKSDYLDSVGNIAVSEDGMFIAISDLKGSVFVWNDEKVCTKLPGYRCPVTSMAIQPGTNYLVMAYSDHHIMEYCLHTKGYTDFSRKLHRRSSRTLLARNFAVHSITFDMNNPNIIIMSDDSTVLVVNKDKDIVRDFVKTPKLNPNYTIASPTGDSSDGTEVTDYHNKGMFNIIKQYKHLVYFGALAEDEIVAVEVSPATLKEKLPSSTVLKLFGRM